MFGALLQHISNKMREATNQVARATIDVRQLGYSEKKFDHFKFGPKYARLQQRLCVVYWELLQYVSAHTPSTTPSAKSPTPRSRPPPIADDASPGGVTESEAKVNSGTKSGSRPPREPSQRKKQQPAGSPSSPARPRLHLGFEADYLLATVDPAVRYVRDYMVLSNVHRLLYIASRNVHASRNELRKRRGQSKAKVAKVKAKDSVKNSNKASGMLPAINGTVTPRSNTVV